MGDAGNKKESMGEEMKKQTPRMGWKNIKTAAELVFKSHKEEGSLRLNNLQFTYSEVVNITNNFQTVIGIGGFGSTYIGLMPDGMRVAVKILSPTPERSKENLQKAEFWMKFHHRNLLPLVGYCNEAKKFILIYEYMTNGSLKEKLSDNTKNVLSWKERLQIAMDVAQGLEYLHNYCVPPIIHRDVKSANILLNENLEAKIAGFEIQISTVLAGIIACLDPEYIKCGQVSTKTDVYSFGIVLLEILTGQSVSMRNKGFNHINDWVKHMLMLETGDIRSIIDPRLQGYFNTDSVQKTMEIAMACVRPKSTERPTITQVLMELKACFELEMAADQTWDGGRPHEREMARRLTWDAGRPVTDEIEMAYIGTPGGGTLSPDEMVLHARWYRSI